MRKKSKLKVELFRPEPVTEARDRELWALLPTVKQTLKQLPREALSPELKELRKQAMYTLRALRQRSRGATQSSLVFKISRSDLSSDRAVIYARDTSSEYRAKDALDSIRTAVRYRRMQLRSFRFDGDRMMASRDRARPAFGARTKSGMYLAAQQLRSNQLIFEAKRPWTDDHFLGIELEFICSSDRNTLAADLIKEGLAKHVHLHGDGSVEESPDRPGDPMEISCLLKQSELTSVVPKLTEVLARHKCYVNATCGMHVHLDMRGRDSAKAFSQLVYAQPVLYGMCPARRKSGAFCKPTRGGNLQRHLRGSREARYKGINALALGKYKTLEVRIHSGTLNPIKIVNWVNLLVAIADGTTIKRYAKTPAHLAKVLGLSPELRDYMIARTQHFACLVEGPPPSRTAPIDESSPVVETVHQPSAVELQARAEREEANGCMCNDCRTNRAALRIRAQVELARATTQLDALLSTSSTTTTAAAD